MDTNTIKKFREALRNGEVKFTYVKKNGEKREARGTMKSDLLPKVEPVRKFDCSDIVWANPGDIKLPKRATVCIAESSCNDEDGLDDVVLEALEERFGYVVESFNYEEKQIGEKKLPKGSIFYFDLDKKGYRSFNESQLFEVELPTK